jgi:AcrR family transcriptional regulator
MFTENSKVRGRGRPRGRTVQGEAARLKLYKAAVDLIGERGYEAATLREVAIRAGVSHGLLYRYFPNKRSVVLALYNQLSEDFASRAGAMPEGKWRDRFIYALELSLKVLGQHRRTLRALAPVMVGDTEEGVFAKSTESSRLKVQAVFEIAAFKSTDAPKKKSAESLGRLLYLLHLGVILWWLLDRTPGQRATTAVLGLLRQILPSAALALRLPVMRGFLQSADMLFREALLDSHNS